MDAILDLIRTMRLSGGVFLSAEFRAPWCVTSQVGPTDCTPFMRVPRHIIAYHYVTAGRLLLGVGDHPPIAVGQGEIVVLPRNDPHRIGSSLAIPPISADDLVRPGENGGLARIVQHGEGERTHVLCGFLGHEMADAGLARLLPTVLKLDVAEAGSRDWIESSLRYAATQLADGRPASPAILGALAELLFMEAVRRYLAAGPAAGMPTADGLADPIVARALGLLHADMTRRWTTEDLAREVGLSRSAFAERFTRAVGEPPMRYLVRQRLVQASSRLRDTADTIARIAYAVGYESEAAFNRAFKREFGAPPAVWRRAAPGNARSGGTA